MEPTSRPSRRRVVVILVVAVGLLAGGILWLLHSNIFTEYPLPHVQSSPQGISVGSDDGLWFTERGGNKLGHMAFAGLIEKSVNEYAIPTANSSSVCISGGRDGNLWFTESAVDKIGRIKPQQ